MLLGDVLPLVRVCEHAPKPDLGRHVQDRPGDLVRVRARVRVS